MTAPACRRIHGNLVAPVLCERFGSLAGAQCAEGWPSVTTHDHEQPVPEARAQLQGQKSELAVVQLAAWLCNLLILGQVHQGGFFWAVK